MSVLVVEEVQDVAAIGFPSQFTANVVISVFHTVNGFGSANAIGIIGETKRLRSLRGDSAVGRVTESPYQALFSQDREPSPVLQLRLPLWSPYVGQH